MSVHTAILIFAIFCAPCALAQKGKKPEINPIDKIASQANFNLNQFAGKWYLVAVASECNYLKENNHEVEATIIKTSVSKGIKEVEHLAVSTFRKLDGICWEIRQEYQHNKNKGRFVVKARGSRGKLDVVIAETDYQKYAIIYYQRQRKITIKLYARTAAVTDDITRRYEQLVSQQGIDMEFIYYFPTYGYCETADQFHILKDLPK
ncbi:complement component C8 gamma chain [Bombina bombina]|uniref:complement component C8 gamma chain n=1 Tax=Bombina bombina TaxID=8345 RepID=UPI00235A8A48|nr:complement component C8 gamma chain [Bombina bombina]